MDYPTVPLSPDKARAFDEGASPDDIVLHVRPPQDGGGIDDAVNLIDSVHHVDMEKGWFREKNNSAVCTFEMWYHNEELDFYFIVPDEEMEDHYRRQIAGYYPGVKIEEKTLIKDKFVDVEPGRTASAVQMGAKKHVFEPILMANGGDDDGVKDPYRPILNEIDSKTDTTVIVQVMYKPLPSSWKYLGGQSLEEYGKRLEESGVLNERLFGFWSENVTDESLRQQGAEAIRNQVDQPAFLTEVRLAVIANSKREARLELDAIVDLYNTTYSGATGQELVPLDGNAEKTIENMIQRKRMIDGLPSGLFSRFKTITGTSPRLVCTSGELASLVHLPSRDDIPISGINYTKALVEGTLPPEAKRFEPVTKDEVQEAEV